MTPKPEDCPSSAVMCLITAAYTNASRSAGVRSPGPNVSWPGEACRPSPQPVMSAAATARDSATRIILLVPETPGPGHLGGAEVAGYTWLRFLRVGDAPLGPHRLAAQDTALSRRRHGFESRWGHGSEPNMGLWSSLECSRPCQGRGRGFKSPQAREEGAGDGALAAR